MSEVQLKVVVFCMLVFVGHGVNSPVVSAQASMPKAADVIGEYIEGLGGEMVVASLTSFQTVFDYRNLKMVTDYNDGTMVWNVRGQTMHLCYNGEYFWEQDSGDEKLRHDCSTGFPSGFLMTPVEALRWKKDESLRITTKGSRQIDGVNTWHLTFEKPGMETSSRFFSKETGLLVQTELEMAGTIQYSYSYTMLQGQLFISQTRCVKDGEEFGVLKLKNLELDPDQGHLKFEFPESLKKEAAARKAAVNEAAANK